MSRAIGLNISAGELQAVEIVDTPGGKEVVKVWRKQFLNDEALLRLMRELFNIPATQEKIVVTAAPYQETFIKQISVPFKEHKKISQMIKYELKPHLPFPVEELAIDFYDTESGKEEEAEVIVTAIREETLKKRFVLFKRAALHIQIMDVENFALFSAYLYSDAFLAGEKVLLIDVSEKRSLIDITDGEKLIFTRTIPKKKDYLKEIDITLTSFMEKRKDAEIKKAVLAGGIKEAELFCVRAYIEKHLKIPVESFTFKEKIRANELLAGEAGRPGKDVIPLGLALRGLDVRRPGVNFAGVEGIRRVWLKRLKKTLVSTVFLTVFFFIVLTANIWGKLFIAKNTLLQYQKRTHEVFHHVLPRYKGVVHHKGIANEEVQLKSALAELEKRSLVLTRFMRARPDALEIIRELSLRVIPRLKIGIEEFLIDKNSVTVLGIATSLDMVNGLKRELSGSRYFQNIKVDLSKSDVSGKTVGFRLTMRVKGG